MGKCWENHGKTIWVSMGFPSDIAMGVKSVDLRILFISSKMFVLRVDFTCEGVLTIDLT